MRQKLSLCIVAFLLSIVLPSCADLGGTSAPGRYSSLGRGSVKRINSVKTTAYTHSESDHLVYGAANAVGGRLKYGSTRSAATDWSVYPVGTKFQIEGEPYVYEVDDYGSALVGTNTIDLYRPSKESMRQWGARRVNIRVLQWGSFSRSLAIMNDRTRNPHVKKMVDRIKRS